MEKLDKFHDRARFEGYEFDLRAGEICPQGGKALRLPEQPFRILCMLLEHAGEVVTREEIRKKLWPNDTIVEFEHSISAAMNRLRQALGDSAEKPRFIETLARRGYRWMVPVEWVERRFPNPPDAVAPGALPGSRSSIENLNGKTVSHYHVLQTLGGGGMGVVYKAEDVKLGRLVALKFLLENVGKDARALERFEREARAASLLNHPNICTIYEVEEHEGQPFIVMELLEGQTLREQIAARADLAPAPGPPQGKPLPIGELLDFGGQTAAGLEAAHSKGIIHRDIKPANIFVTTGGQVKILDFGLAKLMPNGGTGLLSVGVGRDDDGPEAPGEKTMPQVAPTVSPVDRDLTMPGSTMGTAAYMSPEQARGEPLDVRTDLFSFGLVLYEMATGQRAFEGETTPLARDAILNREPIPARKSNPEVPLRLDAIITRALEKDREARYQLASELGADLRRLKGDIDSGGAAKRAAHPWRWPLAGVLAGLTLIASIVLWWLLGSPLPPPRIVRTSKLTSDRLLKGDALASDGFRLFFSEFVHGHWSLVSMPIKGGEIVPVPTPFKDVCLLSSSPDGSELLVFGVSELRFVSCMETTPHPLWVIPVAGGAPRRLGDAVGSRGSWSPDGKKIAWGVGPDVYVMNSDGTGSQKLVNTGGGVERSVFHVAWSPDGKHLRFDTGLGEIWEASAGGTNPHPLLPGWETEPTQYWPTWMRDGKYFIFVARGQLWAIRENPGIFRKVAGPVQLTSGPNNFWGPLPDHDGKRIFAQGFNDLGTELTRFDTRSQRFVPYLGGMSVRDLSFSRDGQWIAYVKSTDGGIWRSRVDGSEQLYLASATGIARLQWSPDGKRIAFFKGTPNGALGETSKVYLVSADGGAPPVEAVSKHPCIWPSWSPDGNSLIFACGDPPNPGIYILDLRTHQMSSIPESGEFWISFFLPDGRSVVANSGRRIAIFDLGQQKWRTLLSMENPFWPTLSRDGRYVYLIQNVAKEAIFRVRIADGKLEKLVSLENVPGLQYNGLFSLAPDDSLLLLRDMGGASEIYALDWEAP